MKPLDWLTSWLSPVPSRGVDAYHRAMRLTDDLVRRLGGVDEENNAILEITGDMIRERHNVPYATSIYQTHQEMIGPLRQTREKKSGLARTPKTS